MHKINFIIWLEKWLTAWVDMICGLLAVLTLGFFRPWWDFKFRGWITLLFLKHGIQWITSKQNINKQYYKN